MLGPLPEFKVFSLWVTGHCLLPFLPFIWGTGKSTSFPKNLHRGILVNFFVNIVSGNQVIFIFSNYFLGTKRIYFFHNSPAESPAFGAWNGDWKSSFKFKRGSRWTFFVSWINSYHFKRLFEHETRCCSTSSERPEFSSKTQWISSNNHCIHLIWLPDFFFFPNLKLPLRGTRFQSVEDVKENSRRELKSIPENAFKKCFEDWIIRWHECIISGRAYFEGDKIL